MTGFQAFEVFGMVVGIMSVVMYGFQRVKRSLVTDLTTRQIQNLRVLEGISKSFEIKNLMLCPKPSWITLTPEESEKWRAEVDRLHEDFTEATLPILTKDLEYLVDGDPQRHTGEMTVIARSVFGGRCTLVLRTLRIGSGEEMFNAMERELHSLGTMLTNPRYQLGNVEDRQMFAVCWYIYSVKKMCFDDALAALASIPQPEVRKEYFSIAKEMFLRNYEKNIGAIAVEGSMFMAIRTFVRRRPDIFGDVALVTG